MKITVRTPSRICLLGEHQDYFGLPVITAAFNRAITIEASPNSLGVFRFYLNNLGEIDILDPAKTPEYRHDRDYLYAGIKVAQKLGWPITPGWDVTISSDIPMGKGVSSSSALTTGWFHTLSLMADPKMCLQPRYLAEGGYRAEVEEFGEPGGKMDHYAVAYGGVQHITFDGSPEVTSLSPALDGLVLGDSHKVKDTIGLLSSIKKDVNYALQMARQFDPEFDLATSSLDEAQKWMWSIGGTAAQRLRATLETRDLTQEGLKLLNKKKISLESIGNLINLHHESLRNYLGISTPFIEDLRDAALEAGALGVKISGSGAGGCFAVLAPNRVEQVIEAIKGKGGDAFAITVADGSSGMASQDAVAM